ncbi:MAG: 2-oxoglutarate dehydrogenase complex dihydrolipoyllysine-residue succinyltransferase [Phycisphaerales bacterium]|jgi:2-oxoglutarate dehydrogenase E2 component (dihydrolipoamide succinyltransferase)|nr:2-oxoglutarate dehydrogenase complex dihydrolipoyllysine-residue succinyltransferase [Phycisphaeraceae bacterium]
MPVDVLIPSAGESVNKGLLTRWLKKDGDYVKRDESILELETDKVTLEVPAPASGVLSTSTKAGSEVLIGAKVGSIDEKAAAPAGGAAASPAPSAAAAPAPAPAAAPAPVAAPDPVASAAAHAASANGHHARATPLAEKLAHEHGVNIDVIVGTGAGGKVREQDVLAAVQARSTPGGGAAVSTRPAATMAPSAPAGGSRRERLSPLRARIAERLVQAQHTAAMLTTFNEVDMSAIMALRGKFKEDFEKKHGVGLGFMSFFVTAASQALKKFPQVNAYLVAGADGAMEVEFHDAAHIAVAVSTPKGLTVPVLRNCQSLSFAQIESGIKDLATKARDGKLALDDLQGGTFTITNGGIFGSLLSTPILNAPQTAILGMHTIKNRPVENPDRPGEIVLRPMMYLALSYDHRLLDGSDAVSFLVAIKNALEKPERMLLNV